MEEEPIYAYDPVGYQIAPGTCVIAGSSAITQCEESDDLAIGMYFAEMRMAN